MSSILTCDEVEALLPLVADGALDAGSDPALFAHLAECAHCQDSLVTHDLIAVSLLHVSQSYVSQSRVSRAPPLHVVRSWWQRSVPAAAAAMLLIGGGWLLVANHEFASIGDTSPSKQPLVARVQPLPSPLAVHAAPATAIAHPSAIDIEIEVVTLPGSTSAHPHYLVRHGEQVVLVTPQTAPVAAPRDARPASFSPHRF